MKHYCSSGGIFDYLKSIIRTRVGTYVGIDEIGAEGHGVKAGRQRLQQDPIAVDNGRKPIAGLEASQGFEQRAQTQSKAARLALNSVGEEVGNGLSIERDLKTDKRRNLGVVINIAADLIHLLGQLVTRRLSEELWSEGYVRENREEYSLPGWHFAKAVCYTFKCPREIPDFSFLIEMDLLHKGGFVT